MPPDKDPIDAANEIIRNAMSADHNYELEQFARQNANLVGTFWQTLGQYMPGPDLAEYRLDLTRLYAIRLIFGTEPTVHIDG